MRHIDGGANAIRLTLDREVELLTSAIQMVASGGAPSMTIAGLHLAEAALEIVRPLADERGVVIVPLWGPDEEATDIIVRRSNRDPA
jgi:DNA-binding transcriptional LysR family regulator